MKLVTFAHDGLARLGAVVGNEVVDGSAAPGLPRDMLGFLEAGRSALDGLARLIESGRGRSLGAVSGAWTAGGRSGRSWRRAPGEVPLTTRVEIPMLSIASSPLHLLSLSFILTDGTGAASGREHGPSQP